MKQKIQEEIHIEQYLLAADNPVGHRQWRPIFRRKRASTVLTREQVKAIKKGRKLLKKELKSRDLKTKEDFELTATAMGLYFDKSRFLLWLRWLGHGRGLLALLGALALLLAALFTYSTVTQYAGHFTINMSDGLFKEGFVLADNVEFRNASTNLFCEAAEGVPCISMSQIPTNVDEIDGQHNDNYFAYTFYIRNEGESTVGYDWYIRLNSESLDLSKATWVMVFEDGEMQFYAEKNADGETEVLPTREDTRNWYYVNPPLMQFSKEPEKQYELIDEVEDRSYYRAVPIDFEEEGIIARGRMEDVEPMEFHKYTVVIWLEGDDPDCTDEMIGGHAGMDFNFKLFREEEEDGYRREDQGQFTWEDLKFWD